MVLTDRPAILAMVKEWVPNFDEEQTVKTIDLALKTTDCFVLIKNDLVVGGISWVRAFDQFTAQPYMQKTHWFVPENHRGYGHLLLQFMESCAKFLGITDVRVGMPEGKTLPGYTAIETIYRKDV